MTVFPLTVHFPAGTRACAQDFLEQRTKYHELAAKLKVVGK
jgi:hypothetical protein